MTIRAMIRKTDTPEITTMSELDKLEEDVGDKAGFGSDKDNGDESDEEDDDVHCSDDDEELVVVGIERDEVDRGRAERAEVDRGGAERSEVDRGGAERDEVDCGRAERVGVVPSKRLLGVL